MIPKGSSHVFWKSVHAGAVKAQRELEGAGTPVDLVWKGPLKEDDRSAQISVVENFISQRVDALILAPLDETALVAPVERATRAGIPVLVFDSGLKSEQIVTFVATDNVRGGQRGGEYLAELLGGKGKVILLRYLEGSASTDKREAGFMEAMAAFPDIEVISDNIFAGASRATAQEASENLLGRFGEEVDGVFCPNESATVGMLLALRRYGRAGGKVKLVGFDGGDQSLEALRAGDIQGLVLQDPFNMGYLSLSLAVQHVQGEEVASRVDTGSTLITQENVDDPNMQALIDPPLDEYLN
jgi:ribose transport system substrate-binding protein